MKLKSLVLLALLCSLLVPGAVAAAEQETRLLRIASHLPPEPVLVWALFDAEPAETWDSLMAMAQRFGKEEDMAEMTEGLAKLNEKLGLSLRDDLLARIGPELVLAFDLPVFDEAMGQVMSGEASGQEILDGIGILVGTPDPAGLEASLSKVFRVGEAVVTNSDGMFRARFSTTSDEGGAAAAVPVEHVDVFFASADGLLALGFSSDWVRESLSPRPAGQRLSDGSDFQRVFAQLDAKPLAMSYLNIPKIVDRIKSSQFVSGMLAASEEAQPFVQLLDTPELTGLGIGATSITVAGGRKTTSFGPEALAGGSMQAGIIAAVLVPNFIDALEKAKQKRTVADMRNVSTAIMSFAADNVRVPGPTDGWVPLASLESALVPSYLAVMPTEDGWGNELQYMSDGESFRIASPGKGGVFEEDLSGAIETMAVDGYEADLVVMDGFFARYPEAAN